MWIAFKNVETGTVHAVSLPAGMSPHGFAMAWPLEETKEPLTCHLCLQFASPVAQAGFRVGSPVARCGGRAWQSGTPVPDLRRPGESMLLLRNGDRNMIDDVMQAAMTTWAAKDLPARLLAGQVAKLLNCSTEDVTILVSAGKLRALGRPKPNAVKFFSSIELITLLADRDWLDEATKTIGQYWRRKNARRNGLTVENQAEDVPADAANLVKKPSTKPSTISSITG